VRLLLESALRLDGQLGRHGCGLSTWGEGRRKSRWDGIEESMEKRFKVCR
jgi:hypothetical protein